MEKAGDILKDILKEVKIDEGENYVSLFKEWSQLVGINFASHSKVNDIANGWIVVSFDHPGWYQSFQFKQSEILSAIQRKYPELKVRGFKVKIKNRILERGDSD